MWLYDRQISWIENKKHDHKRKKMINWASPKLEMSTLSKILLRKWKVKPQTERKYLQYTYLSVKGLVSRIYTFIIK